MYYSQLSNMIMIRSIMFSIISSRVIIVTIIVSLLRREGHRQLRPRRGAREGGEGRGLPRAALPRREGEQARRLYYTILYCTILYDTILYYTILYYTILHYYDILYYIILYRMIIWYTILQLYYNTLYPGTSRRWAPPTSSASRIACSTPRRSRAPSFQAIAIIIIMIITIM